MVLIYTTCKNGGEAKKLGEKIIKRRLGVCANIWPIDSIYFWKGGLQKDREAALLIKTSQSRARKVEQFLIKNHGYTIPFIGTIRLNRLNKAYKSWAEKILRGSS